MFLEAPDPHIRVLWGTKFVTPYLAQPTPEGGKVLAFARDIRLGFLPAKLVVKPEWITPGDVNLPRAADMLALMSHLAPGHPHLPPETPIPERVSVPRASLYPLSLVQPLMVSPLMDPATVWHMIHAKADAIGMTQRVAPFLDWLRAETVDPQQGIAALVSVDLVYATLAQQQGIRTSLVPPSPPPQPLSQILPLQHPFQMQAPAPPPDPTR